MEMATAADAPQQAACAPALSVADVEHGFRFDRDCGIEPRQLKGFAVEADRAARRAHLPGSQRVAFSKAANLMFAGAPPDAFERVVPLALALPAQAAGSPTSI